MNRSYTLVLISLSFVFAQAAKTLSYDVAPSRLQIMPEMLTALRQTNDPWFSEDKFYHLTASAALSTFGYHLYNHYTEDDEPRAKFYSLSTTACIGICKEIYDKKKKNHFSWKDLFWDGIGLALGYFLFID
jgi:uncharacterized protein YfiM (DUF2279 family)